MGVITVTLSAAGPSTPIAVIYDYTLGTSDPGLINERNTNAAMAKLSRGPFRPTIFVAFAPGSVLQVGAEITFDLPDANGNWPSPGNWFSYTPGPMGWSSSGGWYAPIDQLCTGIRLNAASFSSGSATLAVVQ